MDNYLSIVDKIIEDLESRGNLGDAWINIDSDVQAEIKATWAYLIESNIEDPKIFDYLEIKKSLDQYVKDINSFLEKFLEVNPLLRVGDTAICGYCKGSNKHLEHCIYKTAKNMKSNYEKLL